MELLRVELDRDEPEEKSIREHLGVLYVKVGYTLKEGTLVCLGLHRVAVRELCGGSQFSNDKSVERNVVWFQTQEYLISVSWVSKIRCCLVPNTTRRILL